MYQIILRLWYTKMNNQRGKNIKKKWPTGKDQVNEKKLYIGSGIRKLSFPLERVISLEQ